MKKFVLFHIGFEQPTEEIMSEWNNWFDSIEDVTIENVGLFPGKEVSSNGVEDLSFDAKVTTGYTVIQVENLDVAVEIAQRCPSITSIKVQEVRSM